MHRGPDSKENDMPLLNIALAIATLPLFAAPGAAVNTQASAPALKPAAVFCNYIYIRPFCRA